MNNTNYLKVTGVFQVVFCRKANTKSHNLTAKNLIMPTTPTFLQHIQHFAHTDVNAYTHSFNSGYNATSSFPVSGFVILCNC